MKCVIFPGSRYFPISLVRVISLVLLLSLASSQLRDKSGTGLCDANKWSEYTTSDCSNPTAEAVIKMFTIPHIVATTTNCRDLREM
jgi:hypothetical protein